MENIYSNKILKASLSYMELAETGISTAMLNSAIVFEKFNIFDSNSTYLSRDVKHSSNQSEINMFNVNNYIAFNYLKMAINHQDTKSEAMLKLGDYYYYGLYPLK